MGAKELVDIKIDDVVIPADKQGAALEAVNAATGRDFKSIAEAFTWHDIESRVAKNGDCHPVRFIGKYSKEYGWRLPDHGRLFSSVARFISGGSVVIKSGTTRRFRFRGDSREVAAAITAPVIPVVAPEDVPDADVPDATPVAEPTYEAKAEALLGRALTPEEKRVMAAVEAPVAPVTPPVTDVTPVTLTPDVTPPAAITVVAEKAPKAAKTPRKALPEGCVTVSKFVDPAKLAWIEARYLAGKSYEAIEREMFDTSVLKAIGDPSYWRMPMASQPGTNVYEVARREGWLPEFKAARAQDK